MKLAPVFGCNSTEKKKYSNDWSSVNWHLSTQEKVSFKKICTLFILATNQQNHEELANSIKLDFGKDWGKNWGLAHFQDKVREWFKSKDAPPLNWKFIKNIETELIFKKQTEKYIQDLCPLALAFETMHYENELQSFLRQNLQNMFHIKMKGNWKISLLKIFSCIRKLQQPNSFGIKSKSSSTDELLYVLLGSESFNVLVCELQDPSKDQEMMKKLADIIRNDNRKKLIVLTELCDSVIDPSLLFAEVEDRTFFGHLTETWRQQLQRRIIKFQEAVIKFNSIFYKGIPLKHEDIKSRETVWLIKLFR